MCATRNVITMATYWQEAIARLAVGTTMTRFELIGDIFEAHEIKEYTIVFMVGWHQFRSATLAAQNFMAYGITVQNEQLTAAQLPDPITPNFNGNGQDQDPFWMRKFYASFAAGEDDVTRDSVSWSSDTQRVVRPRESLVIAAQSIGSTECFIDLAIRILIRADF